MRIANPYTAVVNDIWGKMSAIVMLPLLLQKSIRECRNDAEWRRGGMSGGTCSLAHSKNENLYFLAPAQTKRMQPILVSCEAPFRSNLQKKPTGPVAIMTLTGPVVQ